MLNWNIRPGKLQHFRAGWLWAVVCALLILFTPISAQALSLTDAQTPDWSRISFSQFPPVSSSGSVPAQGEFPQRSWQAGQTPDRFLTLGDIEDLQPQSFSLNQIGQVIGQDLSQAALLSFPLATGQSLRQLLAAIPALGQLHLEDIPPIAALVRAQAAGVIDDRSLATRLTLYEAIQQAPQLGNLQLEQVDLSQFAIASIPGLVDTALGRFSDWDTTFIQQVPGLNQVPLSRFPNPLDVVNGFLMRVDAVYGAAEADRTNTISGSDIEGFAVPCVQRGCAYVELDDLESSGRAARGTLEGKQWISGKYQDVSGGSGVLRLVNGGKEPTGRLPFGPTFKVVVWEPDETTDVVTTALFFRFCKPGLGCTPYFIGPVPFLTYKVNALMLVGNLAESLVPSTTPSTPTGATRNQTGGSTSKAEEVPIDTNCLISGAGSDGATGVNLKALAEAIASIESQGGGGYQAVGVYTCADGGKNCGRGLGRYQFMNYNPFAATLIAARPEGQVFLNRVETGYQPTAADLMRYFPPEDQDRAFRSSLAELANRAQQQIDPTTGKPFTGTRLVERVAQMHFGGPYSAIDGSSSDALGQLSLRDYGRQALLRYQTSANVCAPSTSTNSSPVVTPEATGTLTNPATGYPITSEFGLRSSPCTGCSASHQGIDIGTPTGTSVQVADSGQVAFAGWLSGYGRTMVVDHGNGTMTLYAHLESFTVPEGAAVTQGQPIARSDSSGVGTGAHLHFEVIENATPGDWRSGQSVDPRQHILF